ncbi:MAG: hypothetical protein K2X82_02865 [Gemmataceae bacterium]|nr:hypothetical protein [Gemmataceae bacterium]
MPPPLRPIHTDAVYQSGPGKLSLTYWRSRSTADILASLLPGRAEALRVKPDGRVMNGNTRLKVLAERGVDIDQLPREDVP